VPPLREDTMKPESVISLALQLRMARKDLNIIIKAINEMPNSADKIALVRKIEDGRKKANIEYKKQGEADT